MPAHADLADDYLAGLRKRGWHDVALEYLTQAAQDPIATPTFLENLGYEQATTQVAMARQAASEKRGQALLGEAAAGFQRFAAEQAQSPLQVQALATAGNLFSEQAFYAIEKAAKLPKTARRQREPLNDTARQFLKQARQPLRDLLRLCDTKLKSLPKAAEMQKNPGAQASRQLLQAKRAEAKFLLAKMSFEESKTYDPDSKAQQKTLKAAASAFAELYEQYEDKLVGFYGRLYQGRCHQAAGEHEQALECYWDIVDQPPIPNQVFRRLVTRAYRYRAECHLIAEDFDGAIKESNEWLDQSRNAERKEPDWLALSYQLASAYEAKANQASGNKLQQLRKESHKLYREIAQSPGEFQHSAKAKLASNTAGHSDQPVEVKTFDEAFTVGKDRLQQMNSAKLAARLAEANNPEAVPSLGEQAKASQAAAMRYFQQAVQLADQRTDRKQLATARYYLCWLYWEAGRSEEAAVLGQFLAQRYPESQFAPSAAKLALAAYEKLYNAAKQTGEPTEFEASKLAEVAEMMVLRWPESPEAATGLNLLINVALRDDRLSDAEKLLEQLPPLSRATAELRLGGALWTRFLQATRKNPAKPGDATAALKPKAAQLLASGYQALQAKPQATAAEATGILYFAQLLLADGQAKQAIAVLENDALGPLSLVENRSHAAQRPEFVLETYKVALRAYVSVQPPNRDRAQKMMTALESAIGNEGNAQQKLINLYVSLGFQLQQQISALTADGQTDKARAVAQSFEDLLARVTKRAGAADDWKIQSWIAQTNLQLGQGLSGKDADRYYQQAEEAYQTLLNKADQDAKFAPGPLAILATRKRLADCLLAQSKFAEALQSYVSILQDKPNMLELQQAAATALQQWGVANHDVQKLEESIRGAMPKANKKNLVWGWLRLATITDQARRRAEKQAANNPQQAARAKKYQNLFFEARYHAAQARLATAELATGAARQKQLRTARQSLATMKRLYPDLGGPQWQGLYLKLLKQMEQEQ